MTRRAETQAAGIRAYAERCRAWGKPVAAARADKIAALLVGERAPFDPDELRGSVFIAGVDVDVANVPEIHLFEMED